MKSLKDIRVRLNDPAFIKQLEVDADSANAELDPEFTKALRSRLALIRDTHPAQHDH